MSISNRVLLPAMLALAMLASGCSTFRGAPAPLLKPSLIKNDGFVDAKAQMDILIGDDLDEGARNAAVFKLMALADVRYLEFRNDIVANRKHTRSASNAMMLAADIAATLTQSTGVKDNYIALSALINGGETIYDKDYLFDRTIEALVAQMDANRKAKQVLIYESLGEKSVQAYPGQAALADVLDYYYMGTINAAVIGVQKSANEQLRQSEQDLRTIAPIDAAQIEARQAQTDRSAKFVDSLSPADRGKLAEFLRGNGVEVPNLADAARPNIVLRQRMNELRKKKQDQFPDFDSVLAALKARGFATDGF
ncbi:MAG: hypothetical protein KA144_12675 [Xanthomonadaceae bacterium]|nr:hypothetical protein [Xanthomonadaceae bacterium]